MMDTPMVQDSRMRQQRTGQGSRRRRAARTDAIGWDEMTLYQRWIVEAGRETPRVQVPDTITTPEQYIDWQMARLAELESRGC